MADARGIEWRKFYASLSTPGRATLLLAAFLLFAPAAFYQDLAFRRPVPFYQVVWWAVGLGLIAVASAEILGRARRMLWLTALVIALPPAIFWWDFWLWGRINLRVLGE